MTILHIKTSTIKEGNVKIKIFLSDEIIHQQTVGNAKLKKDMNSVIPKFEKEVNTYLRSIEENLLDIKVNLVSGDILLATIISD